MLTYDKESETIEGHDFSLFELALLEQYNIASSNEDGYLIDVISGDNIGPSGEMDGLKYNIHTHGLMNSANHLDLQILIFEGMNEIFNEIFCLVLLKQIIQDILELDIHHMAHDSSVIAGRMRSFGGMYLKVTFMIGYERYTDDVVEGKSVDNSNSTFIRPILRVIIYDPNGKAPWDDDCNDAYKSQYIEDDFAYRACVNYPKEGKSFHERNNTEVIDEKERKQEDLVDEDTEKD